MTTPTAEPAPPTPGPTGAGAAADPPAAGTSAGTEPPAAGAPGRPAPHGLLAATAVIATIGVIVALLGVVLLLRPVSTPTQDCGTSLGFLLDGRVDVFVSEDAPPEGTTPAEARANNEKPCRVRVADQTKPAAVLFLAGLVAALVAAAVEGAVRLRAWLKRRALRRAPRDAGPPGSAAT